MPISSNQEYLGLAALLRMHLAGVDLAPLSQSLIQKATDEPEAAGALLDAAIILQFHGNPQLAMLLQQEALKVRRHYLLPAAKPVKLRLLALMAPGEIMANVPLECLLEESAIELHIYYASADVTDLSELPEHDVLFVAIGESEANHSILAAWMPLLEQWPRPVLNRPRQVGQVARDAVSERLHSLPGVVMPSTWRLHREELAQAAQSGEGIEFPLIVRPLDSQAGHDLYKVETPAELAQALDASPGEMFFISPFVDYRSEDGLFRKYRVILIGGKPFAGHMGISSHWMIHYLNAGMADNAGKRAEEARFMAEFDQGFAVRHERALAAIHAAIGLDYLGIDCAETRDGRLLIFEADPAMVVHAMDPVDVFPYKQAPMQTLFTAFRSMVMGAAE